MELDYILMNWKMQADVGKLLGGWPNPRAPVNNLNFDLFVAFLQSKGVADYADVADRIFNKVMPSSPNSHFDNKLKGFKKACFMQVLMYATIKATKIIVQ